MTTARYCVDCLNELPEGTNPEGILNPLPEKTGAGRPSSVQYCEEHLSDRRSKNAKKWRPNFRNYKKGEGYGKASKN